MRVRIWLKHDIKMYFKAVIIKTVVLVQGWTNWSMGENGKNRWNHDTERRGTSDQWRKEKLINRWCRHKLLKWGKKYVKWTFTSYHIDINFRRIKELNVKSKTLKFWREKKDWRVSFWPWGREEVLQQVTKNNHKSKDW